jgi:hypothetical protein
VHRRSGEQVSGTSSSAILHWERANKVFGKRSTRLLERFHIAVLYVFVTTARLPPRQWGATRRRQARGGADRCHRLRCLVIPVLTMPFIPSMILLELILLLQYFILNYIMSMFRSIRFLYTIIVMVMIYFQIILKLKFLFIPSVLICFNCKWTNKHKGYNVHTEHGSLQKHAQMKPHGKQSWSSWLRSRIWDHAFARMVVLSEFTTFRFELDQS